jgi:hypothetical protein
MDIMAFSAHLAAVNLALQAPLFETDNVRIAIADSTALVIGSEIQEAREVFKEAFKSRRLDEFVSERVESKTHERGNRGVVSLGSNGGRTIKIEPSDLVIMNPPFTNCDTLPSNYKIELEKRFEWPKEHAACIQGNLSFQAYFLLLADRLLQPKGRLACVLPLTTFSGKAFEPTINYILTRYTVTAIIVGLGRSAFSENTSISEILFLAGKGKPPPRHRFALIGVKKTPTEWSDEEVEVIAAAIRKRAVKETELYVMRECLQEDLRVSRKGLTALSSELTPSTRMASRLLAATYKSYNTLGLGALLQKLAASPFFYVIGNPDRLSKELGVRGSKYYGFSALFIIRSLNRMKKKHDYLVLERVEEDHIVVKNRYDNTTWNIPRNCVKPCIRRITGITRLDLTDTEDYSISKYYDGLPRIMRSIYPQKKAEFYEGRVKEEWEFKVEHGLSNICLARRINLGAKGTNLIAIYDRNPILLVANSWGFRNLPEDYARILTLWFNSTPFLLGLMAHRMQTEGTFGQIDSRQLLGLKCPDLLRLDDEKKKQFLDLFEKLRKIDFPSLIQQLETGFQARIELDDAFMKVLGVAKEVERKRMGDSLRRAALAQIRSLKTTMFTD